MRIGIITDVHLAPAGHPPEAWHNLYAMADAAERFRRALDHCVRDGAEMIALLGDLSHLGDDETLAEGVALAAATARPVWMVAGNHDVNRDETALPRAIVRVGAANVRLIGPRARGQRPGSSLPVCRLLAARELAAPARRRVSTPRRGVMTSSFYSATIP